MAELSRRDVLRGAAAGAGLWLGGIRLSDALAAVPPVAPSGWTPSVANVPSSDDDLAYLTIAQASALIASGELSPVELVDACLARIERFEPDVRAWITVLADEARAEARAATDEIAADGPRTPLHGIPVGYKDLYDVAGVVTTAGSRVRADAAPATKDATLVARLREAGAITLGKTNTHEFAFGVWTPPTSNPWDLTRTPGGSSGGSGAAIAAGMCLAASGSDTGGSIRIPSSLCNTVGIKATFGRVGKGGLLPLAWSLDHAGSLSRSVEDAALLLNAFAGHDESDPTSVPAPVPDFTAALGSDVTGMVVGVPRTVFFEGANPEVERLVRAAVPVLEDLGVRVIEIDVPASQRVAGTAYLVAQLTEPLAAHEHYLRQRPHDYQAQTLSLFALAESFTAQHYLRAQRIRTLNTLEWVKLFDTVDAVVTPSTPIPAPTKEESEIAGSYELVNYTSAFDFNGCPSISVPAGFTAPDGLPAGLMLSARPFDEVRLLGLAHAYQDATGFTGARPPLP